MNNQYEAKKKVEKIERAMLQEGMKLTSEESKTINDIYMGKVTYKDARHQIINKYKESLEANQVHKRYPRR